MSRTRDHRSVQHADEMASRFLALFNELDESGKGQTKRALAIYAKADRWLLKLNVLLENT